MIDILLSTYNGELYLKEQIDSILNQTYQDFCLIIRDDCSKDNTISIIKEYTNIFPDKIVLIDNGGINLGASASFFRLLESSTSEMIMFSDQDDVWNTNKLEIFVKYYETKCKNINKPLLIHSKAEVVDQCLNFMPKENTFFNSEKCGMEKSFQWQFFQNDVTGCTLLINNVMKEELIKNNCINKPVIQHDWLISLVAYINETKYFIPECTIKYRQHSNNAIGAKKDNFFKRILNKFENGSTYPFYYQASVLLDFKEVKKSQYFDLINEYTKIQYKPKLNRIIWHIKHSFYRQGNIMFKLYQLYVC